MSEVEAEHICIVPQKVSDHLRFSKKYKQDENYIWKGKHLGKQKNPGTDIVTSL